MPHERWNLIDYYESKKLSRGKKLNKHAAKSEFLPDYKHVSGWKTRRQGERDRKNGKRLKNLQMNINISN